MTFKTFLASAAIAGVLVAPAFAFAQESAPIEADSEVVVTTSVQMQAELSELKARETDPATGFVNRFFIRIKIKELENKLNIATALN